MKIGMVAGSLLCGLIGLNIALAGSTQSLGAAGSGFSAEASEA